MNSKWHPPYADMIVELEERPFWWRATIVNLSDPARDGTVRLYGFRYEPLLDRAVGMANAIGSAWDKWVDKTRS